MIEQA